MNAISIVQAVVKEVSAHGQQSLGTHSAFWCTQKKGICCISVGHVPQAQLCHQWNYKIKGQIKHPWGKQTHGINCFETYGSAVTWFAIIIFAILFKWTLKHYTHAPIEMDMCIELPACIEAKHGDIKSYVLKLLMNFSGQKQAASVWNFIF